MPIYVSDQMQSNPFVILSSPLMCSRLNQKCISSENYFSTNRVNLIIKMVFARPDVFFLLGDTCIPFAFLK